MIYIQSIPVSIALCIERKRGDGWRDRCNLVLVDDYYSDPPPPSLFLLRKAYLTDARPEIPSLSSHSQKRYKKSEGAEREREVCITPISLKLLCVLCNDQRASICRIASRRRRHMHRLQFRQSGIFQGATPTHKKGYYT